MTSLPASLRQNCRERAGGKQKKESPRPKTWMFVSTGQAMASGPQCCSTGSSDLDEIRSNTLKRRWRKRASHFSLSVLFFLPRNSSCYNVKFLCLGPKGETFVYVLAILSYFLNACARAHYIDGSDLLRLHARHK